MLQLRNCTGYKCSADDEIIKFSHILGQFMMKSGGNILNMMDEVTGDGVNYTTRRFTNFNQRQILLK
jgi:hypothetical protein